MLLTTDQYFGVDPDLHTLAGLTDEITSTLDIWCEHSASYARISDWLQYFANHNKNSRFEIARQVVMYLRGPQTGSMAIEVNLAISANVLPSFMRLPSKNAWRRMFLGKGERAFMNKINATFMGGELWWEDSCG